MDKSHIAKAVSFFETTLSPLTDHSITWHRATGDAGISRERLLRDSSSYAFFTKELASYEGLKRRMGMSRTAA
ncbi:hypothetical protein ACFPT7_09035 [Acidicapsa dinghuensis]|uniref:Uncharacterized protein n=1 Tax=Acidicapsa dinghuensis TaxID=2218256 RepID=A0ABW1EED2_9BACT|nr:hypothetical protein [Acidicapsa dinghuensis]